MNLQTVSEKSAHTLEILEKGRYEYRPQNSLIVHLKTQIRQNEQVKFEPVLNREQFRTKMNTDLRCSFKAVYKPCGKGKRSDANKACRRFKAHLREVVILVLSWFSIKSGSNFTC